MATSNKSHHSAWLQATNEFPEQAFLMRLGAEPSRMRLKSNQSDVCILSADMGARSLKGNHCRHLVPPVFALEYCWFSWNKMVLKAMYSQPKWKLACLLGGYTVLCIGSMCLVVTALIAIS